MDIPASVFSQEWLLLAGFLLFILLTHAFRYAPWRYVRKHTHVYLGAIVFTSLIWALRAGLGENLNFHFLGLTVITLMFGWNLALIAATAIVTITLLRVDAGLLAIPINTLVMGGIPILITHTLLRWSQRHLPTNIFVFVFVNAFLAAALSIAGVLFAGSLLLWLTETFSASYLQYSYLPYIPLMMFPEALLNGILITIAVVYMPKWIPIFDDTVYLRKRGEH